MRSATSRDAGPVTLELFPGNGSASGPGAATVERANAEARGHGNGRASGARDDGAQHSEAQAQHAAKVRARQNRRRAIFDFFAARPDWRISSAELHQRFGSAFRTRVSELNRDPHCPLRIYNQTTVGAGGEHSYYYAVARGANPANGTASGRQSVGAAAGVEPDTGQGNGSASGTQAEHIGAGAGCQAEAIGREARSAPAAVVDRWAECSLACRCFHHAYMGPGGVPCIACP